MDGGQGGEWLCAPGHRTLTALLFCLKKRKERKKKRKKITSKRKHTLKKKKQSKIIQTQTKQNHQLKYTKYTFTKGGEHGFPVYFLGDLVIQANVAKPPSEPKRTAR